MAGKSLAQWVKRHRRAIDEVARSLGYLEAMNDEERADWVANVEELYRWAQREGVAV